MKYEVTCNSCWREIPSDEPYVKVRENVIGEIVKEHRYCNECATIVEAEDS